MITTPGNEKELTRAQQFDNDKNDAEIIQMAERAQGAPFKHLDKDSFARKSIGVKDLPALREQFGIFKRGQTIEIRLDNPIGNDRVQGTLEGITIDGRLLRINDRYYSIDRATIVGRARAH